jgi:hypothetical protein
MCFWCSQSYGFELPLRGAIICPNAILPGPIDFCENEDLDPFDKRAIHDLKICYLSDNDDSDDDEKNTNTKTEEHTSLTRKMELKKEVYAKFPMLPRIRNRIKDRIRNIRKFFARDGPNRVRRDLLPEITSLASDFPQDYIIDAVFPNVIRGSSLDPILYAYRIGNIILSLFGRYLLLKDAKAVYASIAKFPSIMRHISEIIPDKAITKLRFGAALKDLEEIKKHPIFSEIGEDPFIVSNATSDIVNVVVPNIHGTMAELKVVLAELGYTAFYAESRSCTPAHRTFSCRAWGPSSPLNYIGDHVLTLSYTPRIEELLTLDIIEHNELPNMYVAFIGDKNHRTPSGIHFTCRKAMKAVDKTSFPFHNAIQMFQRKFKRCESECAFIGEREDLIRAFHEVVDDINSYRVSTFDA